MKWLATIILGLFALVGAVSQASASLVTERMNFSVWLDDKEIGFYQVIKERSGAHERINITSKLVWDFLSIPLYTYDHSNTEIWQDHCLTKMISITDDNGEKNFVNARSSETGLALSSHQGDTLLEGCIRSFAYWNPENLKTKKLLNSQTGEHEPVSISVLDPEEFELEKKVRLGNLSLEKPAWGYRLLVDDNAIDLWYTEKADWLALQTQVRGGRLLGYYRVWPDA